jgi:cell division protein FtsB
MPPGHSTTAAPRRHTRTPPSRGRRTARAPRRIRWDKVGRVVLLVVLAVVVGLYVQQGLALLSVRSQADQQRAIVEGLIRQNRRLEQQQQSLNDPATIQSDARALGMVMPGERPYAMSGLPSR